MNIRIKKYYLKPQKITSSIWKLIRYLLLIGISYTILFPLLAKFVLVFMENGDLADYTVKWVPKHFTFENVKISIIIIDYWKSLAISIGICLIVSILQVAISTMSAYSLARFKSKGKNLIFGLVIATLLIPPQTYIVTLYTQFQHFDFFGILKLFSSTNLNLLDTPWTFIILSITGMGIRGGLYIYILKQTFSGLPNEIKEAASVDGAGMWKTFSSIMLPNATPSIVLCFILSFVWQWNDTLYTTYFSSGMETLSMKIESMNFLVSDYLGGWGTQGSTYGQQLSAVSIFLCVIPLVILFIACQRSFVQGVERSGLVG